MGHVYLPPDKVQEAFLAATPYISSEIVDLTVKHPVFLRDLPQMEEWPTGQGSLMEQIVFRGLMPQIEEGLENWTQLSNNTGCAPCEGPNCGYNFTNFGGTALERKVIRLMQREFRSPDYCIKEIQSTAHFKQVFAKTVENLYAQVSFFKEFNISQNILTMLAKKYVVDSDGLKPNTQDPYSYRPKGNARLSMLNIEMLEYVYEWMVRDPSAIPYDMVDGAPVFAMLASRQLLSRLYRDDPGLRQDVRFSGLANDLVTRYNFMSTIRGMFLAAPVLYPRRFKVDGAGNWVRILPFMNGVPAEIGNYTSFNPAYQDAPYEEVILHGKYPFKLFYQPTETTLGANTSFGPEFAWFNSWSWINPLTREDPARRLGYFFTSATLGVAPQFSDSITAIMVERPSKKLVSMWLPDPECPPATVTCNNSVPAVGCPCPLIKDYFYNPVVGDFIINLFLPTTAVATDTIKFGIDTGGYLVGTVVAVSTDGLSVEVTFPNGTDLGICDHFTSLFCDNTLGCAAAVWNYEVNCLDNTRLDLTLSNPISAVTNGVNVTLFYGDGTSVTATVVAAGIDMTKNKWVVDIGGTAFCDQVGGVVGICVPTATDASCPGCGDVTFTQCDSGGAVTPP